MPVGDLIQQSYRYELAPTAAQAKLLASFTGASRFWFSTGLALVKVRLDQRAKGTQDIDIPWSYKSLCSVIAPLKAELCPLRADVVVGSQQAGLRGARQGAAELQPGTQAGPSYRLPALQGEGTVHRIGDLPAPADRRQPPRRLRPAGLSPSAPRSGWSSSRGCSSATPKPSSPFHYQPARRALVCRLLGRAFTEVPPGAKAQSVSLNANRAVYPLTAT